MPIRQNIPSTVSLIVLASVALTLDSGCSGAGKESSGVDLFGEMVPAQEEEDIEPAFNTQGEPIPPPIGVDPLMPPVGDSACSGTPAAGLTVDAIDVNQGIESRVMEGGMMTDPASRNARPMVGRPGVVQAFWGGTAGAVSACLELKHADGTSTAKYVDVNTASAPAPGSLGGAASFLMDAADFTAGMTFSVSFFTAAGPDGEKGKKTVYPEAVKRSRFPAEGEENFGLIETPMPLHVVIIPTNSICGSPVPWDDDIALAMRGQVFNNHPGQEIPEGMTDIVLHDPGSSNDLPTIASTRSAEALGPEYIYSALEPWCANGSGLGYLCEPTDKTCDRVNWAGSFTERFQFGNVIHEIGHNFNRSHTFDDNGYLPPGGGGDGLRDSWGFGVWPGNHGRGMDMLHFFFGDDFYDVNSYNLPWDSHFVSAYSWRAYTDAIEIWGGWLGPEGEEGMELYHQTRSISAHFNDDGELVYSMREGHPPDEIVQRDSNNYVVFNAANGERSKVGHRAKLLSDGTSDGVTFALPLGFRDMDIKDFEVVIDGRSFNGSMDSVEDVIPKTTNRIPL